MRAEVGAAGAAGAGFARVSAVLRGEDGGLACGVATAAGSLDYEGTAIYRCDGVVVDEPPEGGSEGVVVGVCAAAAVLPAVVADGKGAEEVTAAVGPVEAGGHLVREPDGALRACGGV